MVTDLLSRDPKARVVIHVGHNHVREGYSRTFLETKWIAQFLLKDRTGIDPLTVSQLSCRADSSKDVISSRVEGSPDEVVVDLFLRHPRPVFQDGRPTWRRELGDRPVPVSAGFTSFRERVPIGARAVSASPGTVAGRAIVVEVA